MQRKALKTGFFLCRDPFGGPRRGRCCTGDLERKVIFYQEALFTGDSERYVKKKGSGNGQLCP
jgi:hypothetical protein